MREERTRGVDLRRDPLHTARLELTEPPAVVVVVVPPQELVELLVEARDGAGGELDEQRVPRSSLGRE